MWFIYIKRSLSDARRTTSILTSYSSLHFQLEPIFGDTAGRFGDFGMMHPGCAGQKSLACPARKPRHRSFQQQSSVPFDPRPPQCLSRKGVAGIFQIYQKGAKKWDLRRSQSKLVFNVMYKTHENAKVFSCSLPCCLNRTGEIKTCSSLPIAIQTICHSRLFNLAAFPQSSL